MFDFECVRDIWVKHLAQRAIEACWSMAKINRAKNTYEREPSWLVFLFAGAFDKSRSKDGEGATETKNL